MKFDIKINPNIVNSKGQVEMSANALKRFGEGVAEKAHEIGVGEGLVYGAMLATGVYIVTDVICALFAKDDGTKA